MWNHIWKFNQNLIFLIFPQSWVAIEIIFKTKHNGYWDQGKKIFFDWGQPFSLLTTIVCYKQNSIQLSKHFWFIWSQDDSSGRILKERDSAMFLHFYRNISYVGRKMEISWKAKKNKICLRLVCDSLIKKKIV